MVRWMDGGRCGGNGGGLRKRCYFFFIFCHFLQRSHQAPKHIISTSRKWNGAPACRQVCCRRREMPPSLPLHVPSQGFEGWTDASGWIELIGFLAASVRPL